MSVVSVLVPTLRGGPRLSRALASIRPDEADVEVVVLAAPGAAPAAVPRRLRPAHREVRLRRRAWTAEALNALAGLARGRLLLYLNDDAVLGPGALAALAGAARPGRSIAAKVLDLAAPAVLQDSGEFFRSAFGGQRGFGTPDDGRFDRATAIFGAGGPCFLYDAEDLRAAGGFDASLTAYLEDIDVAIRHRAAGGEARFLPAAEALHEGAATHGLYSDAYAYFTTRNQLRLFARLPRGARRALWPAARARSRAHALRLATQGRGRSALRGLRDAFRSVRAGEPAYRVAAADVLDWERRWSEPPPRRAPNRAPSRGPTGEVPIGILAAAALPAARLAARWAGRAPAVVRPAGAAFDPDEADRYPRFRRLVVAVNTPDAAGYANALALAVRIARRVEVVGPDGLVRPAPSDPDRRLAAERARLERAGRRIDALIEACGKAFQNASKTAGDGR